ncbi:MAG: hypothetical protein ACKVU0_06760 [Saprospiraceae bacterium]
MQQLTITQHIALGQNSGSQSSPNLQNLGSGGIIIDDVNAG